jgi:hypothetical protein
MRLNEPASTKGVGLLSIACSSKTQYQANNQGYPITKLFSPLLANFNTFDIACSINTFIRDCLNGERQTILFCTFFVVVILPVLLFVRPSCGAAAR